MTPPSTTPVDLATLFDWSPPRSRKLSLLSFIAASIVLHALCFYIFQIIYPPAAPPLPPPARINLITANSEEGRVLLRWIESEDPALSSTTQRPPQASAFIPPKPEHLPSYANRQPALKDAPPFAPDLRVPSSRPPAPVTLARAPASSAATIVRTSISFSLPTDLGTPELPQLQFAASNNESPQAAQFRIAIDSRGEVRYCFPQDSSGDSALDEQARHHLLLARFPAISNQQSAGLLRQSGSGGWISNDLHWGTATVEWGNDIAAPANTTPPPPAP